MKISDLTNTHDPKRCRGRVCVIHNPTDHHMIEWPIELRSDKSALIERMCEHGVGHPDPDSVAFYDSIGQGGMGIHGCDGCCHTDEEEDDGAVPLMEFEPYEPSKHIFEPGQVWQDYSNKKIVILQVEDDEVTYFEPDGQHITISPLNRVLPGTEWGLIFPNPLLPGTVWRSVEESNTDLLFVLTMPDGNGMLDVAVANNTTVFEFHRDVILQNYRQVNNV